jgi:hypothetical protein
LASLGENRKDGVAPSLIGRLLVFASPGPATGQKRPEKLHSQAAESLYIPAAHPSDMLEWKTLALFFLASYIDGIYVAIRQ